MLELFICLPDFITLTQYISMGNGNRGTLLETIINKSITIYDQNDIALFHKKHLQIIFKEIKKINKEIIVGGGRISKKSSVDYYGIYKGVFVAFEAKSTNLKRLPLSNIKSHQHEYLKRVRAFGGIAFYLISFKNENRYFALDVNKIQFLEKKSISISWLVENGQELDLIYPGILDFVVFIKDLL